MGQAASYREACHYATMGCFLVLRPPFSQPTLAASPSHIGVAFIVMCLLFVCVVTIHIQPLGLCISSPWFGVLKSAQRCIRLIHLSWILISVFLGSFGAGRNMLLLGVKVARLLYWLGSLYGKSWHAESSPRPSSGLGNRPMAAVTWQSLHLLNEPGCLMHVNTPCLLF